MKLTTKLFLPVVALMATAVFASAQDDNNRGDRRGNFEEFRQRMAERLKTSLKVTDEEWTVLQPLIEKVQTKQRDSMMGRFSGFGGRRGGGDGGSGGGSGGGGGGNTTGGGDRGRGDRGGDRAGSAESQALRTALESESTSSDEIKAKLAALREAQKKSAAELAAAREDLRKVVTVRQEAVLVTMGILE
jgi:Spy/CpxP family protein refolding chaperone